MSKLVDMLTRAKATSQPMGFGRVRAAAPKARMLLIASAAQAEGDIAGKLAGADIALIAADARKVLEAAPSVPWGAWMKDTGVEPDALVKSGADFLVFSPDSSPFSGEIARVLEVQPSLDAGLLATANRLGIDAVLLNDPEAGSLTWRKLMVIQRFADILSKPLLVAAPAGVNADQIKLLWEAGVDGIVADSGVKELRQTIDSLEFPLPRRRPRAEALVPHLAPQAEAPEEDEEEEPEEP